MSKVLKLSEAQKNMHHVSDASDLVNEFLIQARTLSSFHDVKTPADLEKIMPLEDRLAFRIVEAAFGSNQSQLEKKRNSVRADASKSPQAPEKNDLTYFTLTTTNLIRKNESLAGKRRLNADDPVVKRCGLSDFDNLDRKEQNKQLLAWALDRANNYFKKDKYSGKHYAEIAEQLHTIYTADVKTPVLPSYIFAPEGNLTEEAKSGFKINQQSLASSTHLSVS